LLDFKKHSSLPALVTESGTLTYRELDTLIDRLASTLACKPQERIAFVASKRWQEIPLFFALWRLQATACPLSFRLPKEGIKRALQRLQPDRFLEEIPHPFSMVRKKICAELEKSFIATILLTSGSTAQPKMAMLSAHNLLTSAQAALSLSPLHPGDQVLLSLPLFHVGGIGLMLRTFLAGGTLVISHLPLSSALHAHKIDFVSLVPTQLYRLLGTPLSLKGILVGGAPLSPAIFSAARHLPLLTTYGMTEMSSQITTDLDPSVVEGVVTSGKPLPHAEVKIAEDGEIYVRGPMLFSGYVEKKPPFGLEGWFATRDLGTWTPEGKLIVLGRKDHLFISGGENIHPEEIERALLSLPNILEAIVIPQEDKEYGARPVAFLRCQGSIPSQDSISEQLSPTLPKFKHPVKILPLPEGDFKVSRNLLQRELASQAQETG